MGQDITLKAEDGFSLSAYRANPTGKARGGVVIVQEIFGVNHHIRSVSDGYAEDGYAVIAPAIFDRVERGFQTGYAQADIERGRAVRGKLAIEDAVKDVRAAVRALVTEGFKVGVVGYCFGGTIAWLAATRIEGVSAAVGYYGGGIADTANEQPKCATMLHFGETDASIPKEHYEKVKSLHPKLPVFIYPAGHGFSCDERASYHAPSAKQARERTVDFLKTHIG